jgi:hypothetical protein
MGWRIVKQPNGLLARFSDITDNFTDLNMTKEDAIALCKTKLDGYEYLAEVAVQAGIDDLKPWSETEKGNGLSRWDDCLGTVKICHGSKAVKAIKKAIKADSGWAKN